MFKRRAPKKWKMENVRSILLFSVFNCPFPVPSLGAYVSLCLIFISALLAGGCGIPNLDPPACTESRTAVREFYSFHFGNDMNFSPESLELRERFLTPELAKQMSTEQEGMDPFTTGTNDFPKAFRIGECKEISPSQTEFQVLLFWRDDTRNEQREIRVTTAKQNEKWLIDKILTK